MHADTNRLVPLCGLYSMNSLTHAIKDTPFISVFSLLLPPPGSVYTGC